MQAAQIKARLLTSGEAEFLWLTAREMDDRLTQGIEIFEWCIGARPTTFVAPVWLYLPALLGTLRRAGIRFTEDHRRVHDLRARRWLDARVLSWATRSRLHRYGSLIHSAAWLQMMQEHSLIRIALHPHDVDHPAIVGDIERVVSTIAVGRRHAAIADCFAVRLLVRRRSG